MPADLKMTLPNGKSGLKQNIASGSGEKISPELEFFFHYLPVHVAVIQHDVINLPLHKLRNMQGLPAEPSHRIPTTVRFSRAGMNPNLESISMSIIGVYARAMDYSTTLSC